MFVSRSAIVVLLFAVSCMDSRAAEPIQYITVTVGHSVMLPCPCSEDTNKLVWQIGEKIVVNHCCEEQYPLHESYAKRTQVFLSLRKGVCSLLLHNVSVIDKTIFTCYTFDGTQSINTHKVGLRVEDFTVANPSQPSTMHGWSTTENQVSQPQRAFSVGFPLSLILVIVAGLIVALLIRKHGQKRPRMVVIQDPQTRLPIMNHTPV